MRIIRLIAIIVIACICGCTSPESKAKEFYETALFEEKQNNFEHAGQLYDEILRKFPNSQVAKEASQRQIILKSRKP
jgi:outer membrane protein assembly factor BamD (BamD/ComL family)